MIHHCAKIFAIVAYLVSAFSIRAGAQASLPSTVSDGFGVCVHFTDPKPGEMKMLADSGARWIRTDFYWDHVERTTGQYDFSEYDCRVYARLIAASQQNLIPCLSSLRSSTKLYTSWRPSHSDVGRHACAQW